MPFVYYIKTYGILKFTYNTRQPPPNAIRTHNRKVIVYVYIIIVYTVKEKYYDLRYGGGTSYVYNIYLYSYFLIKYSNPTLL